MPVEKIQFTSSILGDMTAKAAAFQENKQPADTKPAEVKTEATKEVATKPAEVKTEETKPQVTTPAAESSDKPKNKARRNTLVGLGAAAILITLGVAGRRGKLGPKVQKFLGGAEKTTEKSLERNADEITDLGKKADEIKPVVQKHTIEQLDKATQERIAKLNSEIDRTIPEIDESLKTIKIPTVEDCMAIIEKEVEKAGIDVKTIDLSKCSMMPGSSSELDLYTYSKKFGDCEIYIDFDRGRNIRRFSKLKDGEFEISMDRWHSDGSLEYCDSSILRKSLIIDKEGLCCYAKKESPSSLQVIYYHPNGVISHLDIYGEKGYIPQKRVHFDTEGKIYDIDYIDTRDALGRPLKVESFDETGKLYREKYFIDGDMVIVDI